MTEPTDTRADEYRSRLIVGMVEAIAEIGYADVKVADVVRRARVSKRTFYEHFESKEACLLAVYEAESARLMDEIEAAIRKAVPGDGRLAVGVAVYLASLERRPWLLRTLLIEILHLSAPGLAIRRRVMQRFAELLVREFKAAGKATSTAVAMAIVGGINELVLEAVEEDRVGRLGELAGPVAELMRGVLRGPGHAAK